MEEARKYRDFSVVAGLVGFKVIIGCSEAYFGDVETLAKAIKNYLNDPEGTEKFFIGNDQRKRSEPVPAGAAQAYAPNGIIGTTR
jgi:phosphoglucomutase